jgi:hypothetical protein
VAVGLETNTTRVSLTEKSNVFQRVVATSSEPALSRRGHIRRSDAVFGLAAVHLTRLKEAEGLMGFGAV